jgi:hypothetical protein
MLPASTLGYDSSFESTAGNATIRYSSRLPSRRELGRNSFDIAKMLKETNDLVRG